MALLSTLQATTPEFTQNLFSVQYTDSWRPGVNGVPFYAGETSPFAISFLDTFQLGSGIAGGPVEGNPYSGWMLETDNTTYVLSATLDSNVPGLTYAFTDGDYNILTATDSTTGAIAKAGTPLEVEYYTTFGEGESFASVFLTVFAPEGQNKFQCPAQISNVKVIIKQLPLVPAELP